MWKAFQKSNLSIAKTLLEDSQMAEKAKGFSKDGALAKPGGLGLFTPPSKEPIN